MPEPIQTSQSVTHTSRTHTSLMHTSRKHTSLMHTSRTPTTQAARLRSQRGMSVVEVLVAAGLLLVISLAILAMLTRSLANNTRGWEATQTSNFARTQLDQYLGEYLSAPGIEISAGATENTASQFWASGSSVIDNDADEGWYDSESLAQGTVLLEKSTTVTQFNVKTLLGDPAGLNDDGEYYYQISPSKLSSPLSGDVDPRFANLKRIELTIKGRRQGGSLGAGQQLASETYKSY